MSRPARYSHDLSVAERIQLVEDIWDSIAVEGAPVVALTDAQVEELRRRARCRSVECRSRRAAAPQALMHIVFRPEAQADSIEPYDWYVPRRFELRVRRSHRCHVRGDE
jgi:putative addiction module component (TIGR02574 family)